MKTKTIREIETEQAALIVDDTIIEKKYLEESELICWHFDHSKNKSATGMHLLNMVYYSKSMSLPVSFKLIKKTQIITDI